MRLKALIIFLLTSFTLFGQGGTPQFPYSVSGTVTDSETGRALQYVAVSIPGARITTVTNADGFFTIKSTSQPESLEFNLLGYRAARMAVPGDGTPLKVRMVRSKQTLEEAVVVFGDPYRILEQAIAKIKDNYPARPELFDCFYRETVQKRHRYIFISEAVGRMYKTSYRREALGGDRISVDKSRVLTSPNRKDTLSVKVVGGPSQAVDLDLVKNNELLNREALADYSLRMEPHSMIGDRYQFAIRLIPAADRPYPLYHGIIYIDRETLSFTRFDLSVDMGDRDKVTSMILLKKPSGLRFKPLEVSMRYDYSLSEGASRVRYVRTVIRFQCDWKKRLLKTDFTAVSELVTTDRHSEGVEVIPRKDSFGKNEALSDMALTDSDPEFWKDYNIIEPTESLDRAIGKIVKKTARK